MIPQPLATVSRTSKVVGQTVSYTGSVMLVTHRCARAIFLTLQIPSQNKIEIYTSSHSPYGAFANIRGGRECPSWRPPSPLRVGVPWPTAS